MTGNTGSLRYMAPEVALRQPYTEKADVYSFGIIVWQMARDKVPYKGMTRDEFMKNIVIGGDRPSLDKNWPSRFSDLLTSCWNNDPLLRPSFAQIGLEVVKLMDNNPKRGRMFSLSPRGGSPRASPPQSTWF